MNIMLKVHKDDKNRIEIWRTSNCIGLIHADDLFPSSTKSENVIQSSLYREGKITLELKKIE